jgi:hypothetical protein
MQCKATFDPDGSYSGRLATWTDTTRPCTQWQGITCSAAWRITGIDLSAQGLAGTLCFLLRDLSELVNLRFNNNSFTGGSCNHAVRLWPTSGWVACGAGGAMQCLP